MRPEREPGQRLAGTSPGELEHPEGQAQCDPLVFLLFESGLVLVLVADDDPDVLQLTRSTLESGGSKCCSAANGKQALEVFEAK
ncbi:MAG: hypothetical protein AAGG11_24935 [Pseudomonadota bacterium]